ncbi:MbtH family NRPS accessory protein [Phaeobacter sp. B1627]|uniref:MbtH family NRPS accessory protein n=1 Tax=Phaeobacter sp. B1627 TaxID=2583809 RepID=UPI0011188940|nr:MbtH family NRPS accessory protein [Phaeobacter sp. B1627]TNJ42748.1 MbtH family NRPS accessory protein [Phaeobacter sp. B1627]
MTSPDVGLWLCVVNTEGRWSVWPADLPVPQGWTAKGAAARHEDCLADLETRWSDPRPIALKEAMA